MPDSDAPRLPVLPLTGGVVLPHMTVTLQLTTEEARTAVEAASREAQLLVIVPKVEGRYAQIGTVARLTERGQAPDGSDVAVVEGRYRAQLGQVTTEPDGALWSVIEAKPDPKAASPRARELAHEYRAIIENILDMRGASAIAQILRGIDNPGHLAD